MEDNKITIIDVRTTEEFTRGNAHGSINIPLQAADFLQNCGVECENGGSWLDVNFNISA